MATLTIAVTEEDIRYGRPSDPCGCPVARAVRRELLARYADGVGVVMYGYTISCWVGTRDGDSHHIREDMPEEVCNRIKTYDRTGKMEPFSFEIAVPD